MGKRTMRLPKLHQRREVHWRSVQTAYRGIRRRGGAWSSLADYQLAMESNADRQREFVPVKRRRS